MRGHLLSDLQLAAVFKIGRNAGRPEGVAAELALDGAKPPKSPSGQRKPGDDGVRSSGGLFPWKA